MTGGTRKRGATWSYYFDLGKVDGKRQKKEKGGFKTKKEAEAALAKAINEYNNGGPIFEPSKITVSDYMDFWFNEYCLVNCKTNTIKSYQLSPIKSYHQSRQPPSECAAIVPSDGDFHFPNW